MSDLVTPLLDRLAAIAEEEELRLWAIVDGAQDEILIPETQAALNKASCLFRGAPPELEFAAPWLVELDRGQGAYPEWLFEHGYGKSWFVLIASKLDQKKLRSHFRKFLNVKREDGSKLFFRYYDPRILRVYLPTCNGPELDLVFGPVSAYLVEDRDPARLLRFERDEEGNLVRTPVELLGSTEEVAS